jgi:hypothetical protein
MTEQQATFIKLAIENHLPYVSADIKKDYSGRYMRDKTTHAVIVDDASAESDIIAACINHTKFTIIDWAESLQDGDDLDTDMLVPNFGKIRQDSLGLGLILY